MKKELYFGMFAAAGLLLAASCTDDELGTAQAGGEAQVAFSLGLEEGIGTKAISDGTGAKKLVCAIYDANGNILTGIEGADANGQIIDENAFSGNLTASVAMTLAKGQTYTAVFWAQNPACTAYKTGDLKDVQVSYGGANNDETRDAFFKAVTFTVNSTTSMSIDVVLSRPFAQINAGATEEDWNAAAAAGIVIQQSSVTIKGAATSINLLTGAVSGSVDVEYSLADIPAEDFKTDADGDGTEETYKWLSMSYILVNDGSNAGGEKAVLPSLEFTFKPASGSSITLEGGLTNVPVQRNWRTNILGQLLSSGKVSFNISIDPIYVDEHYTFYNTSGSATELADAAANGGTVTLRGNVVLTDSLYIADGKKVTVNLDGYSITPSETGIPIQVGNNAELTINGKNGSVATSLYAYTNANITLDSVAVSTSGAVQTAIELGGITTTNCNNVLTVKNSTITSNYCGVLISGSGNTVAIENTTIIHNWFGITQNGQTPGADITLTNVTISGPYSGVYLSNNINGDANTLTVTGGSIHSEQESAIEVKKTNLTVTDATLSSNAPTQSYAVVEDGSNGIGYGIVLAGYKTGRSYDTDGTSLSLSGITYNLAATGTDVIKAGKYNGTTLEEADN